MFNSFSDFEIITSTESRHSNPKTITVAIKPKKNKANDPIHISLLIDLTEDNRYDDIFAINFNKKEPLMLKVCDIVANKTPYLPQTLASPSLIRRQIEVCEFEPPCMTARDKIGMWKNYIHYIQAMLNNLSTYIQASNQLGTTIDITLAFAKKLKDMTFLWTPIQKQRISQRSSPNSLADHIYCVLSINSIDLAHQQGMVPYRNIPAIIKDRFDSSLFVISQSELTDPSVRVNWHRYTNINPLPTFIVTDFLKDMIPAKEVSVIVDIKSDVGIEILASDDYVMDGQRGESSLIIKKKMRENELIYIEVRPNKVERSNVKLQMHIAVLKEGRFIRKMNIYQKSLEVDYWLTSMIGYLLECQRSLKNINYRSIEEKIVEASTLNMGISGTDLSLITRCGCWKGIEGKIINDLLDIKGSSMLILNEMAKIMDEREFTDHL